MSGELHPLRFMEYLAYARALLSGNMFDETGTLLARLQNMFGAIEQYGILIFTGCIYFSWSALGTIRWFQVVTLFNPLTCAAEGLRGVMTPGFHGRSLPVLGIQWVLLGLVGTLVVFLSLGIRGFLRRAIR